MTLKLNNLTTTNNNMSNNNNNQIQEILDLNQELIAHIEELKFQAEELKFQNAQLKFLCGNAFEPKSKSKAAPAPAAPATCALANARPPIVMSVAGDYVSVFEDDDNIVPHVEEPDGDDFESTSLNVYWATSFAKEKVKPPTKYNKERYTSSCRACPCGGKTSSINSFALRHEGTHKHQVYMMEQAYASTEYVSEGW